MKKTQIQIEVFEQKDFEEAYENFLKREGLEPKKVTISDMDFALIDYIPADTEIPSGMGFEITIDGDTVSDFDLLYDEEKEGFFLPDGECLGDEFWAFNIEDHSILFDFDVNLFKSFERYTDGSD